jgi:hypothetical protein
MRLPPTQAGGQVLGNTFIDGAHMVLIRSGKQDDFYGASNIVLPCPGS